MFKKIGDALPISIIHPIDVDDKSTKKTLQKTLKQIKESEVKDLTVKPEADVSDKKEDKNV